MLRALFIIIIERAIIVVIIIIIIIIVACRISSILIIVVIILIIVVVVIVLVISVSRKHSAFIFTLATSMVQCSAESFMYHPMALLVRESIVM